MYDIKGIIQGKDYITAIEYLKEENRKSLFLRNCRIILSNFSVLHVKEIWKGKQLFKYSYYWFSANNKLIMGWDNAPHHKNCKSFPHHKHVENKIEPSTERNLQDIIIYIQKIFHAPQK
jgi:hypothetical protein